MVLSHELLPADLQQECVHTVWSRKLFDMAVPPLKGHSSPRENAAMPG